jgi:hypothetical protein
MGSFVSISQSSIASMFLCTFGACYQYFPGQVSVYSRVGVQYLAVERNTIHLIVTAMAQKQSWRMSTIFGRSRLARLVQA